MSLKSSVLVRKAADRTTALQENGINIHINNNYNMFTTCASILYTSTMSCTIHKNKVHVHVHAVSYEHLICCPEEQMTEVILSSEVEVTSEVT